MVGVDSGSLFRWTHSLSRLACSWVGGRLAPFYIHQMNRVNFRNGYATINIVLKLLFFNRKTRVGKKLKKLKRMERLMFRAVVQLKTIVQQNRIETK